MNLISRVFTTLLIAQLPCVHAASADEDLADRFSHRWFDIEIVIFERLPVLDATTNERLTQTRPRQWPHNLLEMGPIGEVIDTRFDYGTQYCYASDDDDESQLARKLGLQPNTFTDEREPATTNDSSLPPAQDETAPENREVDQEQIISDDEQAQAPLPPDPDTLFDALIADYEQQLLNESYQWRDDLTLVNEVKALNRQRDLRPVLHSRWRQPVPPRSQPAPVWVRAAVTADAPATRAGLPKIEGHIAVTVGRYLHFAPTLWYNADTAGLAPVPFPIPPFMQELPIQTGYMILSESRRMRSDEMHYLDHPKFGVIVRIDPVPIPDNVQAAWDTLQSATTESVGAGNTKLSN